MLKRHRFVIILCFVLLMFSTYRVSAQDVPAAPATEETSDIQQDQALPKMTEPIQETMRGIIVGIVDQGSQTVYGQEQKYSIYKVRITTGSKKGLETDITTALYDDVKPFTVGNKVMVMYTQDLTGNDVFYITDYNRVNTMILLAVFFIVLVFLVSKLWGLASLLGLIYSFVIIFTFILPKLAEGANPMLIAITGALVIAPVTFYLSHGLNRKTTISLVGTIISLIITVLLAAMFIELTKLTGYGSEEAMFLQYAKGGLINVRGLLLAGIILGSLGVLDDVTVSQASTVFQLRLANKNLDSTELFHMAMQVGRDHIASMINTLVLVYTGATLPMLLLFINNPVSAFEVVNSEIIAEEVVRTLVGSIGLILSVPITTMLAVIYSQTKNNVKKSKN